ncbi:glycoprotein 3-alpha-L-fucosyltransferase A [Eurytemora carolleeae]|uniref:glycoprotein 3-alpha-L-fucosyltransferase A n=1 Tax=Eurytemora carolleeae TaxID=1294199 RepID=UPI000C77D05F|nr:glycoprotein 3-alpha-L-fucosyltransferase A [Eurytemora carolleeae]|eukprot:XP_023336037.1 glycoprotein 3-alpha-L-fucosyltransferase A-like [Eurytemora affinis]
MRKYLQLSLFQGGTVSVESLSDDEESSEKQVSPGRPRPEEPADQPKIDIGPDEHPPENTRPPLHLDRMSPLKPEDMDIPEYKDRAWYMKKGELLPVKTKPGEDVIHPPIWPENLPFEDRIPEQLMYVPSSVPENQEETETPLKKILLWNGASSWGGLVPGRGVFLKEKCPVSSCVISSNRAEADSSDLILFKDHFSTPSMLRSSNQIWMLYLLECPLHTQIFREQDIFNWTATYRSDSTVVAPYERWQYYNSNVKSIEQKRNYAANKTKQVAWFVSNCGARNERLQYARELSKYINVDIYGACGTERCPRAESSKCFNMLNTDYKFYLAFENSNCKDYITEKFFVNGLGHDVLPIAMGARYEDYLRAAPEKSFLHVDQFKDPEALAAYLHQLDKDDDKYNEYFQWKGTGEFVNTKFFCRVYFYQ